jgi:hypothetical protein
MLSSKNLPYLLLAVTLYLWWSGNALLAAGGAAVLVGMWWSGGLRALMTPDLSSDVGNNQLHLDASTPGRTTILYKRPSQFNRLMLELAEGSPVTHYRVVPRYVKTNTPSPQRIAVTSRSVQVFGSYSAPARTANSHLNSVSVTLFHEGTPTLDGASYDLKVATRANPSALASVRRYKF